MTGESRAVGGVDVDTTRRPGSRPLAREAGVRRERASCVEPDHRECVLGGQQRGAVRVADVESDPAGLVRVGLDEMGEIDRLGPHRDAQAGADEKHVRRVDPIRCRKLPERDVVPRGDSAQRVTGADDVGPGPLPAGGPGRRHPQHDPDQERLSPVEPVRGGKRQERDVVTLRDRREGIARPDGVPPGPPRRCSGGPSHRSKQYHQHSDNHPAAHCRGFAPPGPAPSPLTTRPRARG